MTRNSSNKSERRRSSKNHKRNTFKYTDDVEYSNTPLDDERTSKDISGHSDMSEPMDISESMDISTAIEELCKTIPFHGVACDCTFEKAMVQPFPETGFFEWIDEINERHIVFIFAIDTDGIATQWRLM